MSITSDHRRSDRWANCPHYVRDLVWTDHEAIRTTLMSYTESMPPLLSPPDNELENSIAHNPINSNPHLFALVTPINVTRLGSLLANHPNCPLVNSVCCGFREGFWPWAITGGVGSPTTVDNSFRPLKDAAHIDFVHQQHDLEIVLSHLLLAQISYQG
jgi:hypothetical protein